MFPLIEIYEVFVFHPSDVNCSVRLSGCLCINILLAVLSNFSTFVASSIQMKEKDEKLNKKFLYEM